MRTKYIIFGEALKDRSQKYEQTLPKNCSKSTKIAITVCEFSKFFRGSMPPDTPRVLLLFKLLIINSAGKTALEKSDEIWCALPKKNSQCAPDMKRFQRAYLCPFQGLNVLASLYLVNIQPNSKLHSPTQTFWIRS